MGSVVSATSCESCKSINVTSTREIIASTFKVVFEIGEKIFAIRSVRRPNVKVDWSNGKRKRD